MGLLPGGTARFPDPIGAGSSSFSARIASRQPQSYSQPSRITPPAIQRAEISTRVASSAVAIPSSEQRTGYLRSPADVEYEQAYPVSALPLDFVEASHGSTEAGLYHTAGELVAMFQKLTVPDAVVNLPPPCKLPAGVLDNRELDKLVSQLGRSKSTWRRALMLYEWLKDSSHSLDDRLCTTLIRVCAEHGQASSALNVYDWMRAPREAGGAGLRPTVYTYTAVMRAALAANMLDKALQVWNDAKVSKCAPDCRLAITYIEVCSRLGQLDKALVMYDRMKQSPHGSSLMPTVHAYTAAMRAATEGGRWYRAFDIWDDMKLARCEPTGHAYAAVISACAAGLDWKRAVALFEEMSTSGIKPDVVSCTALISALAAAGEADRAESVVQWMLHFGVRPNVRTYTAVLTAMGNAKQWTRAVDMLMKMQKPEWGGVMPNAYTYSALLKSLGEHGQWQLAEAVFSQLERQVLGASYQPFTISQDKTLQSSMVSGNPTLSTMHSAPSSRNWTSAAQLNGLSFDLRKESASGVADVRSSFSLFSSAQPVEDGSLKNSLDRTDRWHAVDEQIHNTFSNLSADIATQLSQLSIDSRPYIAAEPDSVSSNGRSKIEPKIVNEVVCGALMLAYERAGKWQEAVAVLTRAVALGIEPNTVMYNTAISAAGKAGQLDVAEQLFGMVKFPDAVTHETLVAAYGMAGLPVKAEGILQKMINAGFRPRDYAYCGVICAYSISGDWREALKVRGRMRKEHVPLTLHVYNSLIAACERWHQYDAALDLFHSMRKEGLEPNSVTMQLMASVGRQGVQNVESAQAMATALSAAVAAAGTVLIQTGMF